MTVTITQNLADVAGVADNDTFVFRSPVTRLVGSTVIGTRPKRVTPVAGVLTVQLEPGPCTVSWNRGIDNVQITVPGTDSDLWSLIQAGIATPPTTSADALAAAIGAYLTAHPVSGQVALVPTAVKTSAYTAAVQDLIPCDATSAAFTVTLPSAPADKSRVVVKKIDTSTNAVTIAAGGSDVFNAAGGSTSLSLTLQFQAVQLQYKASGGIWYVVSTDAPLAGLDSRNRTNLLRRPLNNTCVAVGASITAWEGLNLLYPPMMPSMYLVHMAVESMQRIRFGGAFGTSGYTFTQIQSTHLPQVLALSPAPGACIIGECTNDIAGAVPFATTVGILKSMVASLLNAGIVPILTTLPPDDSHSTKAAMEKWNRWIRRYAALNGFPLLDSAAALTGANGNYASASYTTDNLHPTDLGHRLIAQRGLGDGLADIFPPNSQTLTSRTTIDLTNLFGSGSLNWGLFTTNTSGVGTGFTSSGSGGTVSIVAPDPVDNLLGNWQRIASSTGQGGRALLKFISSGWSVGDRLALSARVRATGFNGSGSYFDVITQTARNTGTWTQNGQSVSTLTQGLAVIAADMEGLLYTEFDILASTDTLRLQVDVGAVSGTGTPVLDVGELTVTNLTTGGVLV